MNRSILRTAAMFIIALGFIPAIASAADYTGSFECPQLTLVLTPNSNGYSGEVRTGDQKYPLIAHEQGNHLAGTFVSSGTSYPFTAAPNGNDLTFVATGNTYQLHHLAPAAGNPFPPVTPAAQSNDALANYTVLISTDVGRSLVREIPNVKTTLGALRVTFPDLARFFGQQPTILGAYEDQRDHKSAFVSFSVPFNNIPYKGFVTTKLRDQGAVVFIVFGRQNATKTEWGTLTARPRVADDEGDETMAEMSEVPLTPYAFPDHTGSVGLADGWTTKAQTESNLTINGPADQKIRMALGATFYTPNSMTVRRNQQNGNPLNLAIAPYSDDPATELQNFTRANSLVSQRSGGPSWAIDKIVNVKPIPARNPGGKAAQITYDLTFNEPDGPKHNRVFIQFEASPVTNLGTWGVYVYLQLFAPVETFKKDYVIMMAQAFSLNEDAAVIADKSRREIAAAKKLAEAQQAAAAKLAQARYERTEDIERNEIIKLRSLTDFDEVIRGERTVEDTQTGDQASANLADVHKIVDALNYNDPGRYREIPLRDKLYPLPGHENDPDYIPR
jgi:hypothetical protein